MNSAHKGEKMAALYRRHVSMVYQICLMLMKNVPDAEDATQNVFRKVMEYDKPFRDPEHEKAWLSLLQLGSGLRLGPTQDVPVDCPQDIPTGTPRSRCIPPAP